MGRRGPLPKPPEQRLRRNKPRVLALVPYPTDREPPKPPVGLLAASRNKWRLYWQSDVARAADEQADLDRVVRWIQALDEYHRIRPVFLKTRLLKGANGQPIINPLAGYLKQLSDEIARAENELGLTPLARLRLGITYGQMKITAQRADAAPPQAAADPRGTLLASMS